MAKVRRLDVMVQCLFLSGPNDEKRTTGWVKLTDDIAVGAWVEIEGLEGRWLILSMSEPIERQRINRGWDNNI